MSDATPARYEPLPDLSRMPAWLWQRLPRAGKAAVAAAPIAGLAAVLALAPGIEQSNRERSQAEAQRLAQAHAARLEWVRAEQRPRFAAAAPATHERLLTAVAGSVLADARARVAQPIRRVACEPFHSDPSARYGRYACLAVTHEVAATAGTPAATIGHPYRVRLDFETGRYGFCKVVGREGEAMIATQPLVPLSPSCGGM